MAKSAAATVEEYLAELPEERRAVVSAARDLVRRHLPDGFEERMNWGMICWELPLAVHPDTYNRQPLAVAALAAQKRYCALYLTVAGAEGEARLREAFAAAGKKLDLGKSCLRFRRFEDLVPEAVGEVLAAIGPRELVARYEASRARG